MTISPCTGQKFTKITSIMQIMYRFFFLGLFMNVAFRESLMFLGDSRSESHQLHKQVTITRLSVCSWNGQALKPWWIEFIFIDASVSQKYLSSIILFNELFIIPVNLSTKETLHSLHNTLSSVQVLCKTGNLRAHSLWSSPRTKTQSPKAKNPKPRGLGLTLKSYGQPPHPTTPPYNF